MPEIQSVDPTLSVLMEKLDNLKAAVQEIKDRLDTKFVTRAEFEPVRNIVYGFVAVVLVGVVGALIALVVKN